MPWRWSSRGRKPRILLLADRRGWAFDTAAQAIASRLSDAYEFRVEYVVEQPRIPASSFDLVHVFYWAETYHQRFVSDPRRVIKEISSHRWANQRFGSLTPEQTVQRHLADAGTLSATSRRLQGIFAPFREVHWCPNGFEPGHFAFRRPRSGPLRIGWAGNLNDPCKGVREILEPAAGDEFELAIAGGDLGSAEMGDFYNSIDVLAVASSAEGEPLTLIEGMACGAFPVAVDVGIIPELVRHGRNGLIVERSVEAFREAFRWCSDHLEPLRQAGRDNARMLLETRTWDLVAPQWQQLFDIAVQPESKRTWNTNLGRNDHLAEWPERAEATARLIAELPIAAGDSVLDLGCGHQTVRRFLPGHVRYVPVDRVARTPDTLVMDLEREFPTGRHRAALILGLLEYLERPFDLLSRVAASADHCVFSYNDDPSPARRRLQHWRPAIHSEELVSRVRAMGGRLRRRVELGRGLTLHAFDFTRGSVVPARVRSRIALLSAAATSTNSGDAVITDAIRRILAPASFEELPLLRPLSDVQIEQVNTCEAAIVCGTNLYQRTFACALDEDALRRIQVPVIPLGIGSSAPIGELPDMNARDARLVRLLHERCQIGSVRDPISLDFVRRLGVRNVELTGCPVLFHGLARPDFATAREGPLHVSIRARLLHVEDQWLEREIAILRRLCRELRPTLVLQSPFDVPIAEELSREFGVEFVWDPGTHSSAALTRAIAVAGRTAGFRLHFGMLGLSHGRPATLIGSDTRVASFCEMMELPWHDVRRCREDDVVRELREPAAGIERFLHNWDSLRDAMAHVLRENDLPFALER
jgi:hypothetical protein